ncbi:hypothetical protein MIR68_001869 [Amoeboaphelidium protococcarum]|nr:hypothetical protein MIR68_001869 [Amoeboaphelidium protococcarum]
MKLKRTKQYRKTLQLYETHFGFHQPYLILVDGTFLHAVQSKKQSIVDIIQTAINAQVKVFVTPCILAELKNLLALLKGKEEYSAMLSTVQLAKSCDLRICKHHPTLSGSECYKDIIGDRNNARFIVATQDDDLKSHLRSIGSVSGNPVPLIHQNRAVTVLESANRYVIERVQQIENDKFQVVSRKDEQDNGNVIQPLRLKRKRAKGPNPLSCKKPKARDPSKVATDNISIKKFIDPATKKIIINEHENA